MAEKKSTQIYHDWIPTFEMIGNRDKATGFDLIISLLRHGASGEGLNIAEPSEASFTAEVIFENFAKIIDRDIERYKEVCERNRENAYKRHRPQATASDGTKSYAKSADKDKDKDKDKDIYITSKKSFKTKFHNFDERLYTDEDLERLMTKGGRNHDAK